MKRRPLGAAVLAVAGVMLALEALWIGVLAWDLYERLLGPLKSHGVVWPAALAFYALYVLAITTHAVIRSTSKSNALRRGAELGLVSYATFALTSWAILADWPAILVPIDIAWGVAVTALSGLAGRAAFEQVSNRS